MVQQCPPFLHPPQHQQHRQQTHRVVASIRRQLARQLLIHSWVRRGYFHRPLHPRHPQHSPQPIQAFMQTVMLHYQHQPSQVQWAHQT